MPITDTQAIRFATMIREWEAIAGFLDKCSPDNNAASTAFRHCADDVTSVIAEFETGGDL